MPRRNEDGETQAGTQGDRQVGYSFGIVEALESCGDGENGKKVPRKARVMCKCLMYPIVDDKGIE